MTPLRKLIEEDKLNPKMNSAVNPNLDEEDRWNREMTATEVLEREDKWRQEVLFRSAGHAKTKAGAEPTRTPLPPFSFRTVLHPDPAVGHIRNEILDDLMSSRTADDIIAERAKTHGDFAETARVAQTIRYVMREASGWARLNMEQREALDQSAVKIARAVCGDGLHVDHFADIGGYARLGELATVKRLKS